MFRLVIVDDEEKIVDGIADLFPWSQIGFLVVGKFQSAKEAIEFIEKNQVDVVLSDIEMPSMNGFEFCNKLNEMGNIKIILFSSHQNYEYFRMAIKNKVFDYLLKPIKYDELLACFEKIKEQLYEEKGVEKLKSKSYYEKIIDEIKNYIEENYKEATLELAAERVNLSSTYLSKIFKEKSGVGFMEYLLKVRMENACKMLENIHFKTYDIAYYIGYDNPKNFSRAFKAYYNISPTEYRNKKTSKEE